MTQYLAVSERPFSQTHVITSFAYDNTLANQNLFNDFLSVFAPTLKAD